MSPALLLKWRRFPGLRSRGSGSRRYGKKGAFLRRCQDFRRHELGLAGQLFNRHRHVLVLIDLLKSGNIGRAGIDHHKFYPRHFPLHFMCCIHLTNILASSDLAAKPFV
jgi:hypothetical protein